MNQNVCEYRHLLLGAPPDLDCACCLEIDEFAAGLPIASFVKVALSFFESWKLKPKRVSYSVQDDRRFRRSSIAVFQKRFGEGSNQIGESISYVGISSEGIQPDEISQVWTPRAFVGAAVQGRILNAFFFGPARLGASNSNYIDFLRAGPKDFASAQIFSFPLAYSPLSYFAGGAYQGNDKRLGAVSSAANARITNWRNHCYRGNRPSQGYMRDLYSLNVLSGQHIRREVQGLSLLEWISSSERRGVISEFGTKWLWRIPDSYVFEVQKLLEQANMLLAGEPSPLDRARWLV